MPYHLLKAGQLTSVHIGRGIGHMTQARGTLCTARLVISLNESQLLAGTLRRRAERSQAVEYIGHCQSCAQPAATLRQLTRRGKYAGIMELIVGKKRAVVTIYTLGLADKQAQS